MLLVRDIMYCKPGKVRALADKFVALAKLSKKMGAGPIRVMTDVSAERFWTVVTELEVESLDAMEKMFESMMGDTEQAKEFQKIMEGYHDLVSEGRREIYKLEG